MLKIELQSIVKELREFRHYENVDISMLDGIGLKNFNNGQKKMVSRICILRFLQWQTYYFGEGLDEKELIYCLELLKNKVVMI